MNTHCLKFLLFLFTALMLFSSQQAAAVSELTLVCDNYNQPDTCYLDDNGVPPVEIIGVIGSILAANEGNGDDKCQTQETGELECDLGSKQQKLRCSAFVNGNTLCNLSGLPEGVLSLDCNVEDVGGRCELSSNPELVADLIDDAVPNGIASANLKSYIGAVFNCATRNAFGSLVSVCDSMLSALANGEAVDVLEFLQSTQPLNPEAAEQRSYSGLEVALDGIRQRLFRLRQNSSSDEEEI